jgi:hypothetical protein
VIDYICPTLQRGVYWLGVIVMFVAKSQVGFGGAFNCFGCNVV